MLTEGVLRKKSVRDEFVNKTTAGVARATASHSIDCPAQAVLGGVENALVWMEEASRLGYSPKRRELAWSRVSFGTGHGSQDSDE